MMLRLLHTQLLMISSAVPALATTGSYLAEEKWYLCEAPGADKAAKCRHGSATLGLVLRPSRTVL